MVLVGGGLGVAPIYPQLREYKLQGNRTVSIVGFRNRDLMFREPESFRRVGYAHVPRQFRPLAQKAFLGWLKRSVAER